MMYIFTCVLFCTTFGLFFPYKRHPLVLPLHQSDWGPVLWPRSWLCELMWEQQQQRRWHYYRYLMVLPVHTPPSDGFRSWFSPQREKCKRRAPLVSVERSRRDFSLSHRFMLRLPPFVLLNYSLKIVLGGRRWISRGGCYLACCVAWDMGNCLSVDWSQSSTWSSWELVCFRTMINRITRRLCTNASDFSTVAATV